MPTLNTAAVNAQIDHIGTDYATANVVIYDLGNVALATHTLQNWGAATGGTIGASNLPNLDTIDAAGAVSYGKVIAGTLEITVTTGLTGSGAELILADLDYILGGTSRINSLTMTQPVS